MNLIKKLLCVWMAGHAGGLFAADYYVSQSGSDSNTGTLSAPFKTIAHAYSLATAGSTIYVRGGVYMLTTQVLLNKNGTGSDPIRLFAYQNETPILDGTNMGTDGWTKGAPLRITGNYNHVRGFEVRNGPEFGAVIDGSGSQNIFERLNVHHTGHQSQYEGKGVAIFGSASDNLILNCDSHHNRDLNDGNADGFQIGSSGTGNILRGNRAYKNSDDGYDFWNGAPLLVEGNVAFENGYDDNFNRLGDGNGFKLGGQHSGMTSGGHTVRNNVSFRNALHGFDENSATYPMTMYNNTAYMNGPAMPDGESWGENFYFVQSLNHVFRNNLSVTGTAQASGDDQYNSWNLSLQINSSDFISMDHGTMTGTRSADGSLPYSDFLRPAANGDLIDQGVAVGLPYSGASPDLGAYEFAPSQNLVSNPGFEELGQDWEDFGNSSIVSNPVNSGAQALRVYGEGGRGQIVTLVANTNYKLTVAGRRGSTGEWCGIGVSFKNSSGGSVGDFNTQISGTSFTTHTLEFTAPSSFAQAKVYVWKDAGSNDCFVDDFNLVDVP